MDDTRTVCWKHAWIIFYAIRHARLSGSPCNPVTWGGGGAFAFAAEGFAETAGCFGSATSTACVLVGTAAFCAAGREVEDGAAVACFGALGMLAGAFRREFGAWLTSESRTGGAIACLCTLAGARGTDGGAAFAAGELTDRCSPAC